MGGLEAIEEVVCVIADLLNRLGGMMSGRQLGLQLLYLQRLPLLCVQVYVLRCAGVCVQRYD